MAEGTRYIGGEAKEGRAYPSEEARPALQQRLAQLEDRHRVTRQRLYEVTMLVNDLYEQVGVMKPKLDLPVLGDDD